MYMLYVLSVFRITPRSITLVVLLHCTRGYMYTTHTTGIDDTRRESGPM